MVNASGAGGKKHWLVRPSTIKGLWVGGIAFLAALVGAGAFVHGHAYFEVDGSFAFYAWYGFATCAAMVVAAKGLGILLKRRDDYYDV